MTKTRQSESVTVVRRRPYAVVPMDILVDSRLSRGDRVVLMYLLALADRPGWTIYLAEVQRTMDLSPGGWKACRRRLEAAGYYFHRRDRAEKGGKWRWTVLVTDTPGDFGGADKPRTPAIGHIVTDGGATDRRAVDRHRPTDTSRRKQQHFAAAAPRATWKLIHGLTCWTSATSDGPADAAALVSVHGAGAVEAKAGELRARGIDPLPSVVARELLSQAAAREAARRREAVLSLADTAEDAATAASRAEAQMAAYRAGRAGGSA